VKGFVMPTFTTQYVYFDASGSHTRQPRSITSYGGFTPIPTLNPGASGSLAAPSTLTTGAAPATVSAGPGVELKFAFTNLSGCVGGPQTAYSPTTALTGTVGADPILVLYVYVPVGGGNGNGQTGAVIDAFDATTGSLVDNDFVTVSPDPGGKLTTEANVDGWVPTTDSAYIITADHPNIGAYQSLPTTALFDRWVDLTDPAPPASLVSGANLTPAKGASVYALAFYKDPVATPPPVNPCQAILDELNSMSPGDFPNFPAYQKAREAVLLELEECEKAHTGVFRP
jgi:hypothetical protein